MPVYNEGQKEPRMPRKDDCFDGHQYTEKEHAIYGDHIIGQPFSEAKRATLHPRTNPRRRKRT